LVVFAAALALWGALTARAATWDVSVPARSSDNFDTAEFRLWLDDNPEKPSGAAPANPLRALIVLAPGWNGDGRGLAADRAWQQLARELGCGLVGVHLKTDAVKEGTRVYHQADRGSGAAWLAALAKLAQSSGRPEIAKLPWLAWGHSAGGQWAYGLACVYPDRVASFVAVKGGVYQTRFNPLARAVPGLFVIGENDETRRAASITDLFERERRQGAAWAVAWEANSGHEVGRSGELARSFLREAAALRLPTTAITAPAELIRLHVGQGWVGQRSNYTEAVSWPTTAETRVRTVWLPGPESARVWRELGGEINSEAANGP
jgi:pimeloyl-ACP methyl ester carboxylesterase